MVTQAKRRNGSAIRSGRVQLQRASASALPFANETFNVVFEINSFNHWDSKESGLVEVLRVLRTRGRFVMVLRQEHSSSLESDLETLDCSHALASARLNVRDINSGMAVHSW
jgi:ubiquinone/menaquinone biosynthesis C-methylase UbiE